MTLSYQQYNQVLHKSRLSTDTQKVEMVRRVGARIARAAETFLREAGQGDTIKNYPWEFNLIEDEKTANAWVMPGGRAAVYSSILRYTQDGTGLAVVLGHGEIQPRWLGGHLLRTESASGQGKQLGADHAWQGLVHHPAPLRRARTLVRQDLAAGRDRTGKQFAR